MPLLWDGARRDQSVALAVFQLLCVGGVETLTMRRIAQQARMAVGTLTGHYPNRDVLLTVVAREIGDLIRADQGQRAWEQGLASFIAQEPRDLDGLAHAAAVLRAAAA